MNAHITATYIEVHPISGSIGAEIHGVDLAHDLAPAAFDEIRRAFREHLVLFFPGQRLEPRQQTAFARRFGPLIIDPFMKSPDDSPELMVVVKEAHEKLAFGEGWHSDSTFLDRPPMASFLYARAVPPYGGDTMFANQYLAYEALSPGLRSVLDGLKAVHTSASYNVGIASGRFGPMRTMKLRNDAVMDAAMQAKVEHPVVRTHPETGRKALYVNRAYTVRFKDWSEEESWPLLEYLFEHAVRPEFTCRYRWATGTLAVWDNRCAMHNPVNDYHGQRREMHRVVAEGDRPV